MLALRRGGARIVPSLVSLTDATSSIAAIEGMLSLLTFLFLSTSFVYYELDLASWESKLLNVEEFMRSRTMLLRGTSFGVCVPVLFTERLQREVIDVCAYAGFSNAYELQLRINNAVRSGPTPRVVMHRAVLTCFLFVCLFVWLYLVVCIPRCPQPVFHIKLGVGAGESWGTTRPQSKPATGRIVGHAWLTALVTGEVCNSFFQLFLFQICSCFVYAGN